MGSNSWCETINVDDLRLFSRTAGPVRFPDGDVFTVLPLEGIDMDPTTFDKRVCEAGWARFVRLRFDGEWPVATKDNAVLVTRIGNGCRTRHSLIVVWPGGMKIADWPSSADLAIGREKE